MTLILNNTSLKWWSWRKLWRKLRRITNNETVTRKYWKN